MLPGDDPRHAIKLARMSYAYTSDDPLIGNFKSSVVEVSDYTAGNGTHRGWETGLHDNGDKFRLVVNHYYWQRAWALLPWRQRQRHLDKRRASDRPENHCYHGQRRH